MQGLTAWLVVAGLFFCFVAGMQVQGWRMGGELEAVKAAQVLERAGHIELNRLEERRRSEEMEEVQRDAQKEIERIAASAAVADRTADGLQRELTSVRGRLAKCSSSANGSETARDTGILLADMLGEMERAGRALAAEADRRGVAGRACESAYVTQVPSKK